jgi:hypothetical protein
MIKQGPEEVAHQHADLAANRGEKAGGIAAAAVENVDRLDDVERQLDLFDTAPFERKEGLR